MADIKMTNLQFVEKLLSLATDVDTPVNDNKIKTLYVSGGFGVNIGYTGNKEWYINNYEFNSRPNSTKSSPDRVSKIRAAKMGTFGFDCVGMVKGILFYGWNGYRNETQEQKDITFPKAPWDSMDDYERNCRYGGAKYDGRYDFTIERLLSECTDVKEVKNHYSNSLSDFDNEIAVGEFLTGTGDNSGIYDKNSQGHCGVYIGNGLSIETTYSKTDGVQLAYMNVIDGSNIKNAKFRVRDSRWWKFHGKLSKWVDYVYDYDEQEAYDEYINSIITTGRIGYYHTNLESKYAQDSSLKNVARESYLQAVAELYETETENVDIEDDYVPVADASYTGDALRSFEQTVKEFNTEMTKYDPTNPELYKNRSAATNRKISGVEGIPYQYMASVDARLKDGSMDDMSADSSYALGMKFSEKIMVNAPLLYLIPCRPVYLEGFSKNDINLFKSAVMGSISDSDLNDMLESSGGRYYTCKFAHAQYYNYLNPMLAILARLLNIHNKVIPFGEDGKDTKIGEIAWQNELKTKIGFNYNGITTGKETLLFYLDGLSSIDESFSNSTTQSAVASMINGWTDYSREIIALSKTGKNKTVIDKVGELFGGDDDSTIVNALQGIANTSGDIIKKISSGLGLGVVGSLFGDGIATVANGGKIVFPDLWADSTFDRSYSLSFKFRSPDHDPVSIFLNVLKPYCKLLALTLPHMYENNGGPTAGYISPFLVKAYCKGMFNIDYGLITGLSASKGSEGSWTDDGLPTQIDVSIEISDLYHSMAMSGIGKDTDSSILDVAKNLVQSAKDNVRIVKNTAYMDFLSNMAGLNIADMAPGRSVMLFKQLYSNRFANIGSEFAVMGEQMLQTFIGDIFKRLN